MFMACVLEHATLPGHHREISDLNASHNENSRSCLLPFFLPNTYRNNSPDHPAGRLSSPDYRAPCLRACTLLQIIFFYILFGAWRPFLFPSTGGQQYPPVVQGSTTSVPADVASGVIPAGVASGLNNAAAHLQVSHPSDRDLFGDGSMFANTDTRSILSESASSVRRALLCIPLC